MQFLLPFSDDSTLFFALRMRRLLAAAGVRPVLGWLTDGTALCERQLGANLPGGPDMLLRAGALASPAALDRFAAIVTARIFAPLRDLIRRPDFRHRARRPVVVAFQGGLDFTPERGFAHRRHADVAFVVPRGDVARCRAFAASDGAGAQIVGFGHPAFLRPPPKPAPRPARGDIVFFAQALSPPSRAGRVHMLQVLAALARAHPDRRVVLKLRHLPGENALHLHRETHDYPGLMARALPAAPPNLITSVAPIEAALAGAARAITCTSTAAIDAVAAGVPVQVYLDYVEAYLDPLAAPMRALFAQSGLLASLPDLLEGSPRPPAPGWVEQMFCPPDLGERVVAAVQAVRARPLQVHTVLEG